VQSTETGARVAIGISVVSLLLSGWTFNQSLDDDADRDRVEERLVCLKLPGADDCGPK
jgi:hypothetical protein